MRLAVAIAACTIELTRSCYWCLMQYMAPYMQFHLMRHFAFRIHRNVANKNGLGLIFAGQMYGTGVVLTLGEQAVRL